MGYTTLVYQTPDGRLPFEEWLSDLRESDRKGAALVEARLARVRAGNFGNHRSVDKGVWELKIPYGPGYRVYYGLYGQTVVVLLTGGDKGEQKRDIVKAREYADDFRRRI